MQNHYNFQKRKLHDSWALIAFLIFTIVMNIYYFQSMDWPKSTTNLQEHTSILLICFSFVVLFYILATLLVYFIPGPAMHAGFLLSGLLSIIGGILSGNGITIILGIISGLITFAFYFFYARKNIKFCAGVCKSATSIIVNKFHVALPCVLSTLILVPLQILIASFAFSSTEEPNWVLLGGIIFHNFWLFFGLLYFLRVHISSIVAINIFSIGESINFGVQCFKNSMYCLGSVFFGALIMALVETARALVNLEQRTDNRENNASNLIRIVLIIIVRIILAILSEIINLINEYVFVYMALYGTGYFDSIKKAYEVLTDNNKIYLNSLCIQSLIFIMSMCGSGLFYCVLHITNIKSDILVRIILSFGVFLMIKQYMEIFDAGTKAFLFANAKEPERIQEKYPETYKLLKEQVNK